MNTIKREIFLSYAMEDAELADEIKRRLETDLACRTRSDGRLAEPVECFKAHQSINKGKEYMKEISDCLRRCVLGLVLITANSRDKGWVQAEALTLRLLKKPAFPIVHGNVELPRELADLQQTHWEDKHSVEKLIFDIGQQVDNSWITRPDMLFRHLKEQAPLEGLDGIKNSFAASNNLLCRSFLQYWHAPYYKALDQAHSQRLPLQSADRETVAIRAIRESKAEIRAITIVRNDRWLGDAEYATANVEAAKRKVGIRRLVVLPLLDSQPLKETEQILRTQLEHQITLKWIDADNYVRLLRHNRIGAGERNVLICDGQVMTRSFDAADHAGELVLGKEEITDEEAVFDSSWGHANELSAANLAQVLGERENPRSSGFVVQSPAPGSKRKPRKPPNRA
jgi:hypothetical protein